MRHLLRQFCSRSKNFGNRINFEEKEGCMIAFKIESKVGSKIREPLKIFILISRQFIMSIAEGKFELDLMRGYEESFRNRMSRVVSLSYDCMPLNPEQYSQKVLEVFESIKTINPNDKDLNLYDDIILGKIEGQPTETNFKRIVESIVGEISEEKLKAYLKQKSQQRSFGASNKDKNCCIRQVKKLQCLQKYFDVQEIAKKRKYNKLYSAAIKSLAKYLEFYGKIVESDLSTIEKAFEQYNIYNKEEKKFGQFVKEQEQSKNVVEKPAIVEEIKAPAEPEAVEVIEEQHKIVQIQQIKQKNEQQKKASQPQAKTPKKSKPKRKETKPQDPSIPEANLADATEKEKCESAEREKKNNLQREKQLKQKEKTVKKPSNKLLTEFFGFKKEKNVEVIKKPTFQELQKATTLQAPQQPNPTTTAMMQQPPKPISIWDTFGQSHQELRFGQSHQELQFGQSHQGLHNTPSPLPQLCFLRNQFRTQRMQNQQYHPEPHYTNIIMTLSTIEYYDYMMQVDRQVDFANPFKKIRNVLYFEDESEEFEGESADLQEEDQEDQQQLSQGNHTILSDDHLSNQQLSSCQPNDLHLKIEYGKARKWVVNFVSRATFYSQDELQISKTFSLISLETDQSTPLRLDQQEQSLQFLMTPQLWRDVYKLAHGYYATKDSIIKDLSALLPGVSKNWIDSMLRERSQKIANQRFIKRDFVEDLKEKVPEIDSLLQKVLEHRNQELRKIRQQKNQQKDLKLQKDILQCTGSRYIVNLIKQLKQKGYKQMRRNQLIEFINERKGEQWDKIKAEMNTMSRPIEELIRNMPVSQRIYEEVEVQDEEFMNGNKQNGGEGEEESTKDKNHLLVEEGKVQGKDKKSQQKKQLKTTKMKKRKNKQKNIMNIYEKTKPISRGRRTKNSLKTGIPSIDELKKLKEDMEKKVDGKIEEKEESVEERSEPDQNEQQIQGQGSQEEQNENGQKREENNRPEHQQQTPDKGNMAQNIEQQKKSVSKSVILSQIYNQWPQKESPIKQQGTAQKIQQRDNLMTVSNIEQQ